MTKQFMKHRVGQWTFTMIRYQCHGHMWEVLLSRKWPERYNWRPVCPDCPRRKT